MSADRHITPRVIAHIYENIGRIPVERRASADRVQLVLRQLCRWARRYDDDDPGRWVTTETVEQLSVATFIPEGSVRRALDCLELLGLSATLKEGGGRGLGARGSTRLLTLDPVHSGTTARGNRAVIAQFDPADRLSTGEEQRAVDGETARGKRETARGRPRDTASSSALPTARASHPTSGAPLPPCERCEDGFVTVWSEGGVRSAVPCTCRRPSFTLSAPAAGERWFG